MHMILHRVNKLILKKTKTVLQFIKASQRVTNSQSFHKKNQHSPIDSASNKCYITTRTKEGDKKRTKDKSSMNSQLPKFQETR